MLDGPLPQLLGSAAAAHAALLRHCPPLPWPGQAHAPCYSHGRGAATACASPVRAHLHHLGWALGIQLWQEDWRARFASQSQAAPPHATNHRGRQVDANLPGQVRGAAETQADRHVPRLAFVQQLSKQAGSADTDAKVDEVKEGSSDAAGVLHAQELGSQHGCSLSESEARDVIESIRREDFGLGLELQGEGAQVCTSVRLLTDCII